MTEPTGAEESRWITTRFASVFAGDPPLKLEILIDSL